MRLTRFGLWPWALTAGLGLLNGLIWGIHEAISSNSSPARSVVAFAIDSIWGALLAAIVVFPIAAQRSRSTLSDRVLEQPHETTSARRANQFGELREDRRWDLALKLLATASLAGGTVLGLNLLHLATHPNAVTLAEVALAGTFALIVPLLSLIVGLWAWRSGRTRKLVSGVAVASGAAAFVVSLVLFAVGLIASRTA